ncbi:MAG: hypothetical protein ACRBB3_01905 [Alphaproteobacteria bacterium]
MSVFLRILCVSVCAVILVQQDVRAADVPLTFEETFGVGGDERNTCDPEFWDVLKDRAWMEAQRELTQNQNLIPRPDSVLEMTCFDSFLDELGSHADSNFPSNPRWSEGGFSGIIIDGILSVDQSALNAEPLLPAPAGTPTALFHGGTGSSGLIMTAVLEVLVLDQLVSGVTSVGDAQDVISNPLMAACVSEGKQYYLEENFPDRMLGGRAIGVTPPSQPSPPLSHPTGVPWSQIVAGNYDGNVRDSGNYNGCSKMNDLWNRTKCYDFATESHRSVTLSDTSTPIEEPPFPAATSHPGGEHDGFYTLETYQTMAASNDDYRTRSQECAIPTTDGEPDWPSTSEFACDVVAHGIPSGTTLTSLATIVTALANNNPTWSSAHTGANPPPNSTPATSNGGVDEYLHYLDLRDSSSCSTLTPIKTGYIVKLPGGTQYIDAVCPAPGCYFDPPSTLTGNGSCN